MRLLTPGSLAVGCGFLAGCATHPERHGPLPVRNQHPAQLTVMHLPPASTEVLPAGNMAARADAAYSSLFLSGSAAGGANSFRMDGEYLRAATQLRVGLGGGAELAVELPVAHASGGFLDSFLIDYHKLFGFPDQGRSQVPEGDFSIVARDGGQTAWQVEPGHVELLDVPLFVTWQLRDAAEGLGLAVRGGVELPTGNADRGYGSGELDYSAGILLEHHSGQVTWYGHLQHTLAGTPDQARAAGLHFADVTSLGLGAELPLMDTVNALVQVEYETSTLRNLGVAAVERDQFLLWCGARWRAGERWAVEVGFGEDLQGKVSPDFTAWLGITTVLGGSSGPSVPAAGERRP
jgi:hypothetical protein